MIRLSLSWRALLGCMGRVVVWAALLCWVVGCASVGSGKPLVDLAEGMDPAAVRVAWGEPTEVSEYDDGLGHHVRWVYHRTVVLESMYWSFEPRRTAHGMTTEAVRRGRPYSRKYVAGWVVFREDALERWQTYDPPLDEPGGMRW